MQEERKILHRRILLNLGVSFAWIVGIILFGPWLLHFFAPLIVAWMIAMIANPLVNFLEKRIKIMRKHGSVIVIASVLTVVALLLVFVVREIILQISEWVVDLPELYQTVMENINNSLASLHQRVHVIPENLDKFVPGDNDKVNDYIIQFLNSLTDGSVHIVGSVAGSVIDGLILFILTIMLAYFFVADREKIYETISRYTPKSIKNIWKVFRRVLVTAVGGYLKACFKIMFIMFAILWVFFIGIGAEHAMVIAVITAIMDFLPFIGTGTILLPWAAYHLLTGGYVKAVVLAVAYLVTMIVRRLIEPKLVGDSIGISPFFTLMSMFIGYRLLGMIGLIVGIPAGMIVKALVEQGAFESQIRGIKILAEDICEFRKY
ncbi:MAG: sporulation integral membrane protein YtvI [Lachnospiraceae bacterium]|nr:sporulation integral membrane protein YtvI [Lachnospiraceae bacterium]